MSLLPNRNLADPSTIEPYSAEGVLQVVIETPKGSRNKYAYDPDRRVLVLKKVLPPGMSFPYDFGFVPSTKAGDGDPIDVLVLMDEPTFPGCIVEARVIGVITGEDEVRDGKTQRNDRVLAVAALSQTYEGWLTVNDVPQSMLRHMEAFFAQYPRLLNGKTYKLLGVKDADEAGRLIEEARNNA